jgi:cell division protease FtsH
MQFRSAKNKGPSEPPSDLEQSRPKWVKWVALVLFAAFAVYLWFQPPPLTLIPQYYEIGYSQFRKQLIEGNVAQVTISGESIKGVFKEEVSVPIRITILFQNMEDTPATVGSFLTYIPTISDDQLFPLLEQQGVEILTEPPNQFPWLNLLITIIAISLVLLVLFFVSKRLPSQGQGILSMGKSRARLYSKSKQSITFMDVAGMRSAKTELREIVHFLKEPERFQRLGGEIPRGVLLVGPPGTGKTLLARAVAGEAEAPFFSLTGSDFMEIFVGIGASRVRDLFKTAKKNSPSIVFIDELDSIGQSRAIGFGAGHQDREQTLNQLLSEMDGFEPNEGVIVMAATNRPDILDPALLRPGRFDRRITVNLPALKDRIKILQIHGHNKPLDADVDLEKIARGTPGFSGADLENLLNEAALLAAREGKESIANEDIEKARDKIMMGLEWEGFSLSESEVKTLSYHEAGHALLAALLPNADPIHKVSIVPRGKAMGVTQQLPEGDKYIFSKAYLLDRLAVMMGGRAAEELILQSISSGAQDDLNRGTQLARKMVLDWAMSEKLGPVALGSGQDQGFLGDEIGRTRVYSEATAREVDKEIKQIMDRAYEQAMDTLKAHEDALDKIAEKLTQQEELTGEEVQELIGKGAIAPS